MTPSAPTGQPIEPGKTADQQPGAARPAPAPPEDPHARPDDEQSDDGGDSDTT